MKAFTVHDIFKIARFTGVPCVYEGTTQAVYEVIFIARPVTFNMVKLSLEMTYIHICECM